MIRSNQAGQAKNRPPRREEGENGNLQRFPLFILNMFFREIDVDQVVGMGNAILWRHRAKRIAAQK
ncbi:hypothetical protein [Profundibacter sp.]|uniref:hypothetical protein n=1 Tax=Profundibacter sp. TaxID=3101071 RepID=UPI003D0DB158